MANSIPAADRPIDLNEAAKFLNSGYQGPYEKAWNFVHEQLQKPELSDYHIHIAREKFGHLNVGQLRYLKDKVAENFAKIIKPRQQAVNQTGCWFKAIWIGAMGYFFTSALRKTFNPLKELRDDTLSHVIVGTVAPFSCVFLFYGLLKCTRHPQQVVNSGKILSNTLALGKLINSDLECILSEKEHAKTELSSHQIETQSPESEKGDEIAEEN